MAVAHKLKELDPTTEIIYVGERGSRFSSMTKGQAVFDRQYKIFAGKFRRYHGESWFKRLLDVKTNLRNLRDLFYVFLGIIESWFLLRRLKPDVILLKGGFVGVPIGLAARHKYPLVTHDSDAIPGMANRLVSRWATYHATGMPPQYYKYPSEKMRYTGVIVSDNYQKVTGKLLQQYRHDLDLPADAQVLMITGGSNGAQSINLALAGFADDLLKDMSKLHIIHQVGVGNETVYGHYTHKRLQVYGLMPYSDLYKYSGAADVIVTRAGANTIAEYGIQAKACIIIPNPLLTGGHQTKNAQYLKEEGAALILDQDQLVTNHGQALKEAITDLLNDQKKRHELGQKLHNLAVPEAALSLAQLLVTAAKRAGEK
ncbi:MAG: UDP-N-acetylglucosamine--N-acetylmuramyl-(pentapeptide) pyrophosphoryl-undecaprenol [Patescibacteria group bacterium]|nr:UDP-N-acetylglucosamine--N-acetylmuramyl-(pentapeptide) pyrophosphoryl-undecaprenol [Patescibacteria group bacterium]